ncbi:cold shock domain-containing protein [Streptomyces sp. NBC_01387]|uniref:cold-shock protein n=1 Tax=unclassified Streptomyces TaxID=2593676 RepID=UPI00202423CA|nr:MULTISPECIES: cold shock domain-containing protein [unclassified Streptomyces]MCX4547550.1 cold shock domain-containing protein [Streptomyces sp. NBC_01500]WSC19238.1 cold shock domain-containing protein [Streptomyces sp. NBC_01766]WSV53261.1 cold shock domain-containing protein [Streptomyces sp. NBC_01014]
MTQGMVVRFDEARGYGFIAPDDGGDDVFVHANELSERGASIGFGTRVEFSVLDGGRGPKAYGVHVVDTAPPGTGTAVADRSGDSTGPADAAPGGPVPTAGDQPSAVRGEGIADGLCEVFSKGEFTRHVTELLLANGPDLTGKQVLALRAALVDFASQRGWVD